MKLRYPSLALIFLCPGVGMPAMGWADTETPTLTPTYFESAARKPTKTPEENNDPSPTLTAAEQDTATSTPVAGQDTETPQPPTETPQPTRTPHLTETPQPSATGTPSRPAPTPSRTVLPSPGTPAGTATRMVTPSAPEDAVLIRQNFIRPGLGRFCTLDVRLAYAQEVTIKIYGRDGTLIRTLADSRSGPGALEVMWEGKNDRGDIVGSGIYIILIQTGEFQTVRKVVVVR